MFVDELKIFVKAGKGGDGALSFRREKFVQRGGPDGGHGGHGGSIHFQADNGESSLGKFYNHRHFKAEKGRNGEGQRRNGRKGEDITVTVPLGTLIYEVVPGRKLVENSTLMTPSLRLIATLDTHGETMLIARGGIGGKGNASFATSIDQVPYICEKGAPGEDKQLFLELKTIADVGLVGFPNAGKSTLLSKVTRATPKIADYPFTTIIPNVGVMEISPGKTFTIADIPGIIEGASEGRGLGFKFLRHIERCRLLLYLVDLDTDTPEEWTTKLNVLFQEVKDYDDELFHRTTILCGNKIDTPRGQKNLPFFEKKCQEFQKPYYSISAHSKTNLDTMCHDLFTMLKTIPLLSSKEETYALHTLNDTEVNVEIIDNIYVVHCEKIERTIAGTDLSYPGSLRYVYRMFRKYHIDSILTFHGIQEDDIVELGGKRFRWI